MPLTAEAPDACGNHMMTENTVLFPTAGRVPTADDRDALDAGAHRMSAPPHFGSGLDRRHASRHDGVLLSRDVDAAVA